jgi:hypothetical protein
MKIVPLALLLLQPVATNEQDLVPPEVVRFENVHMNGDEKTIIVGNANRRYSLFCNIKSAGCITPVRDRNYFLFDGATRWKMPGAKVFITLAFVQDWTVTYDEGENIGLVPEQGGAPNELGLFVLDTTDGRRYEQDTIFSDGPIIYGTGMSEEDRAKAWKLFVDQMAKAAVRQQGTDALRVKLARRCLPGEDSCTMALDANLVGVGGIPEPTKVLLLIVTDLKDPSMQLSRTVCTRPKGKPLCRDWNTGKLIADY